MSTYRDWHVGMEVVCIATPEQVAKGMRECPDANYPYSNGIYTIRDMLLSDRGEVVLLLNEVDNRHLIGKATRPGTFNRREPGCPARLFRPVQKRATDISVFKALLAPTPSKQLVENT